MVNMINEYPELLGYWVPISFVAVVILIIFIRTGDTKLK